MRTLLAIGLAATVALLAPAGAQAKARSCGTTKITYDYGSYRFAVAVTRGKLSCTTAKRIIRQGVPASGSDPRGWTCREARGKYSDVCYTSGKRRIVRARVLTR